MQTSAARFAHRARTGAPVAAACLLGASAAAAPAPAPSEPVTDTYHGVSVPDPYRNLENLKRSDTLSWLKAQGEYGAELLSRIEGRDAMAQRVEALAGAAGDVVRAVTRMPGERIYYLKRKVGENQLKLVMRVGQGAPERVLVDPGLLSKAAGVPHAINYFVPSWDGKTLAYGMSAGGSEQASLYLLDIASGKPIGAPIPRVHDGNVHWSPDSQWLTYNQLRTLAAGTPDTETYLDTTVFLLWKGQPEARAKPLLGPLVNPQLKLDRHGSRNLAPSNRLAAQGGHGSHEQPPFGHGGVGSTAQQAYAKQADIFSFLLWQSVGRRPSQFSR